MLDLPLCPFGPTRSSDQEPSEIPRSERERVVLRLGRRVFLIGGLGKPHELFRYEGLRNRYARPRYDVSPDGERFLVVEPVEKGEAPLGMVVVENRYEEFRGRE